MWGDTFYEIKEERMQYMDSTPKALMYRGIFGCIHRSLKVDRVVKAAYGMLDSSVSDLNINVCKSYCNYVKLFI